MSFNLLSVWYELGFGRSIIEVLWRLASLRENCANTKIILVRIFPYLDWIRENTDQKKLRVWSLFTQGVFSAKGVEAYSEFCQTSKDGITVQKNVQIWSFFCSVFSLFLTDYGKIRVRKISAFGHFLQGGIFCNLVIIYCTTFHLRCLTEIWIFLWKEGRFLVTFLWL